ncbi:MAG: divalent-cation tolerance protein CutA [Elusimicrobiota bacterium]|nr:MAG: divalent-cation tolerance protein CutA [Elusimicrobiota bacterium]
MATRFRVVLITAPRAKADKLAKGLVSARLAACVNVVPGVVSHYRWKGKLHKDAEALLIAKTMVSELPALKRWVEENHPYDVPEVLILPVEDGAASYLGWLAESLR